MPPDGDDRPDQHDPDLGLTIDDVAARVGMTVRNVRAHATRGLLPAPTLRGRTAYYGREHLARLELIAGLQRQGFSLAAIEAVVAHSPASSAEHALAFYRGMLEPWQAEEPAEVTRDELAQWLGAPLDDAALDRLAGTGVVEPLPGDRVRVADPALLRAGGQVVRLGVPAPEVLALHGELRRHVAAIAEVFVGLFRDTVWAGFVADGLPECRLPEVERTVQELQPVAARALLAAFRSAMRDAVRDFARQQSDVLTERRAEETG
jgi:DNA-binding transcriptional MerR regulator